MDKSTFINHVKITDFIKNVLIKEGCNVLDSEFVAGGLVHASLRGIDSHGIRLLPHYLEELKCGRINKNPEYIFSRLASSCGNLDADHGYGMAAGIRASRHAVELAKESGVGIVTVIGSSHFGAASYYGVEICKNDMIGCCMTHSDPLIVPTGGKRGFTGNNPICFTAPGDGEEFFCLDMATSTITFNKVRQFREENKALPPDAGIDINGKPTDNPFDAVALMPVGGYKGYGLAVMVEILCSILTGVPYGPNMVKMFDDDIHTKRNLGQFYMAIRINAFTDILSFKKRLSIIMNELRSEPSSDPERQVKVAGDPEIEHEKQRLKSGIPLRAIDMENFHKISEEYKIIFI